MLVYVYIYIVNRSLFCFINISLTNHGWFTRVCVKVLIPLSFPPLPFSALLLCLPSQLFSLICHGPLFFSFFPFCWRKGLSPWQVRVTLVSKFSPSCLSFSLSLSFSHSLSLSLFLSLSLGLVLCDYVRSNGGLFAGKRVLELGAGNGLLGVVLSRLPLPPASIVLSDHHPKVCVCIWI